MVIRESVRSVRIFFTLWGLVGVGRALQGLRTATQTGFSAPAARLDAVELFTFDIAGLCFMLAILYAGVFLPRLLRNSPGAVLMLLRINIALSVFVLVVGLNRGDTIETVIVFGITLLILMYLLKSVRRLATEVQSGLHPESIGTAPTNS